MAVVMKGAETAARMKKSLMEELTRLKQRGVEPKLGIIRVGTRPDDLSYERGALARFRELGIAAQVYEFPEDVEETTFFSKFAKIDASADVHGILLFRPLPKRLNEDKVRRSIHPLKDVDGMNPVNIAKVFAGESDGFAPCTPAAVMEMLAGVELAGKSVAVVGRSMVVGRPLAMLMVKRDATVTICHTKTRNTAEICRAADVVVAAVGKAGMLTSAFVSKKSIVLDVGINVDKNGNLRGDVDYDAVAPRVSMISPVPGGVGAVTTSVLASHVLRAASLLTA
ncbi:MAG: bifunctional 5,10-methylenetetrahydrofolate dehydrogenase/5,10-methenyltetrahydrofolate cyclohydrolase [Synergistaceae bacterium]|jgi:methylenetetrahydrofolate dehydrogenase (NADP+)/methenyltetrahydrofolate cyclohydrolase|nr:bifunctional 5,10-methylenetetrahydrofolate dehydrogenase/5,10-methenyltetrahydrofolate cyclohydrolase [Synergistaceae bacterium]